MQRLAVGRDPARHKPRGPGTEPIRVLVSGAPRARLADANDANLSHPGAEFTVADIHDAGRPAFNLIDVECQGIP